MAGRFLTGKYAIRTRLDPGTQATVVFPSTKSCTTSTSQMPAVYFIPLYSLICLSIASTRSTRYHGMYRRPNYNIPQVLGVDCIFVLRVLAVYEGTNGQNAAITGTTTLCCVFRVFRTESTRRVLRTASTCEYSHYEPIRLFAVLPGMALLPPRILAALAVESTTGEPLSTVRNINVLPEYWQYHREKYDQSEYRVPGTE